MFHPKIMLCIFAVIVPFSMAKAQTSPSYQCTPAIGIVADLGYCFGFSASYYKAIEDQATLTKISTGNVEANIANVHERCYPTSFSNQKTLGELAFSSYLNLEDDRLLRQTAKNCNMLMTFYANQNTATADY
jgi:hypothetical protein